MDQLSSIISEASIRLSEHVAFLLRMAKVDWHNGWAEFPGLEDRVLSKCSDAHIYLDQGTCSPF